MKTYSAKDYAMYYLTTVPKTVRQVEIKLLEKGYPEAEIQKAIVFLQQKHFLDDEKYVEMYLEDQAINKGKPLYIIKGKLIQKGIEKRIIEKKTAEMKDEIEEGIQTGIQQHIQKMKDKGLEGMEIIQKLYQKGYNAQMIRKTIKEG